jgi:biotin transport system permease protein
MAHTVAFSFRNGSSILHRLDPRFKIIFLALISLSTLKAGIAGLLLLTLVFGSLAAEMRLPLKSITFELRYFSFFLLIIFVAKCLTEQGIPLLTVKFITVTDRGIIEGALASWRLALIILMGLLFSFTTRPKDIRTAVEILFTRVPLLPEKRIAIMIGLIVRFIPVILHLTREVSDAQRARAIEQRKNPIYRASRLVLPIMRRTLGRAELLANSMESRCFDENRPTPALYATAFDWWTMIAVLVVCIFLLAN